MNAIEERKNRMSMLIGFTWALGFSLCAFEYGKPLGNYIYKGFHSDNDRWIEEDPVQVALRLPEPPKQMPKPKPRVAMAVILPNFIDVIDNADKRRDLPDFEINPNDVYVPLEYIDEPIIDPLDFAEEMTEFPGGEEGLIRFLGSQLKYPSFAKENGIEGPVYIKFVVNEKGDIEENTIQILGSPHAVLSQEAIRVIKAMPLWKPGKQRLKNVAVNMKLPIKFLLN
ncbi:energy transducer TonB [Salibacteraceae bacterium]|nr:energy transducer TonB [Salibacteraceae bacterium]